MGYYLAPKRNKVLIHAIMWINLTASERSQTEGDYYMIYLPEMSRRNPIERKLNQWFPGPRWDEEVGAGR